MFRQPPKRALPMLSSTSGRAAAPKGLPSDVRAKLEIEIAAAINSAEGTKSFNDIGFDVVASNGTQFVIFLADETQRWKKVTEAENIVAE